MGDLQQILNYCRVNYGSSGISDEYEEELKSRFQALIDAAVVEALHSERRWLVANLNRGRNREELLMLAETRLKNAENRIAALSKRGHGGLEEPK